MYTFRIATPQEVDAYSEKKGVFFQTSAWAGFKSKYGKEYIVGEDEKGNVVLSCLLFLIKVKCTPFSIGYAMRGPVCDLANAELLKGFTAFLHSYMKKNRVVYTAIDPYYTYKTDFEVTPEGQQAFDNLKNEGYIFFPDKAHSIQRPTNYKISWDKTKSPAELEKEIFGKMEKKLRNDIEIAEARGLEPVKFKGDEITEEVFEAFYSLLVATSQLKDFGIRSKEYYVELFAHMKKYITVYFYRYNAETDIKYTQNILDTVRAQLEANRAEAADPNTTPQKRERLAPKEKELVKQLTATEKRLEVTLANKNAGYLSTYLCIRLGEKAHDFYGANSPLLRDLRLTSNYWDMIKDCFNGQCESFDMGGTLRLDTEDIKQDKTYDLYQYKSRYHGALDEFIGEFYLVENKLLYTILHDKIHYLRRVLFRN